MKLHELNHILIKDKLSSSLGAYFKRQGLLTVQDILEFYPSRYQDRRYFLKFPSPVTSEQTVCLTQQISVCKHDTFIAKGQRVLKLGFINHAGEEGCLLCFNRLYLAKVFPIGTQALVYGSFSYAYGQWTSANFDIEKGQSLEKSLRFGKILSIYRGQTHYSPSYQKYLKAIIDHYLPILEDDIPAYLKEKQSMYSLKESLKEIHYPTCMEKLELAKKTLEKREIFYLQASLIYQAKFFTARREKRKIDREFLDKAQGILPYSLSYDQKKALAEILEDLEGPCPMNRLLQGDVGTGKTLVAFLSALGVLYAGEQVAFMAPTELLARQHLASFEKFWASLGFKITFISGSLSASQKSETLKNIQSGKAQLILGTHSLFSQPLEFSRLGYIIVDEQQKFGLAQREKLKQKGFQPDILLMSATPIPRTMALTLLDITPVSTLLTKPVERIAVKTFLAERANRERVYVFMEEELEKGHQAYIVHPVINKTINSSLIGINGLFEEVKKRFSNYLVTLLHSRLKEEKKVQIMQDFVQQKSDILISTSMVEVGVDVPNATVMVISGAEYFGLASLHQLRGRVGRSVYPSYCFLLYTNPLEETAKKRLKLVRESQDGFYLAEQDLKIRGSGDFISEKQSGRLALKLFSLDKNEELFMSMKEEVKLYFSLETPVPIVEKQALYEQLYKQLTQETYT